MSRPPLRILCFGDSLTAGWPSIHPYAGKLEEKLAAALPHLQPICEVDGVPGNKVAHGSYRKRMERAWQRRSNSTSSSGSGSASYRNSIGSNHSNTSSNSNTHHHHHHHLNNQFSREKKEEEEEAGAEEQIKTIGPPSSSNAAANDISEDARSRPKYDWTIVLGGTNDLAYKVSPNDVVDGLRRTWGIPLSRGGKVLALTIPEVGVGYFPAIDEARDEINEAIREYERPNFFYFDLHSALPYLDMPPAKRSRIWLDDGVHLTEEGYDYMGEKIAESLIRIIRLAEAQETEISNLVGGDDARRRRAIQQLIYEEERGDPRLLSQGYIIVRKTDLD